MLTSKACAFSRSERGEYTALPADNESATFEKLDHTRTRSSRRRFATVALYALSTLSLFLLAWHAVQQVQLLGRQKVQSISSLDSVRKLHGNGRSKGRIRIGMMIDKPDQGFCRSLFSILSTGYEPPQLLNFGRDFPHRFGEKILRARELISESRAGDDDVYAFVDGSDVLFQIPEKVMYERFTDLKAGTVFSAEKTCWPFNATVFNGTPKPPLPSDMYGYMTDRMTADGDTRYFRPQFVNAGVIFGSKESLHAYYEWASKIVLSQDKSDDQAIMGRFWTAEVQEFRRRGLTYTMDYRSSLVQNMWNGEYDVSWEVNPHPASPPSSPLKEGIDLSLDLNGLRAEDDSGRKSFWDGLPLMRNKVTNAIPGLMHFNGGKQWFPVWWKRMWFRESKLFAKLTRIYLEEDGRGRAGAWDGEVWHSYKELCGGYDLDALK